MKKKKTRFQLYRYQILPINRRMQFDAFDNISSLDDLLNKKNKLFEKVLLSIKSFEYSYSEINHQLRHHEGSLYLFRFGVNRFLNRETKDFDKEELDNWPSFYAGIWNKPDKQYLIVEERKNAFHNTQSFVKVFESNINSKLERHNLTIVVKPLFEEHSFWDVVKKYDQRVESIYFELITPNLANISDGLNEDLKKLAKDTNTSKTNLNINSDKNSSLTIEDSNDEINNLVDYSSEGGGDIKFKIKKLKYRISLGKSVKTVQLDDIYISGLSTKEISDIIKDIAK